MHAQGDDIAEVREVEPLADDNLGDLNLQFVTNMDLTQTFVRNFLEQSWMLTR